MNSKEFNGIPMNSMEFNEIPMKSKECKGIHMNSIEFQRRRSSSAPGGFASRPGSRALRLGSALAILAASSTPRARLPRLPGPRPGSATSSSGLYAERQSLRQLSCRPCLPASLSLNSIDFQGFQRNSVELH